jgi:hypothetical protein
MGFDGIELVHETKYFSTKTPPFPQQTHGYPQLSTVFSLERMF